MLNALTSYINDNYGSKRGFLAGSKFLWMQRLGLLEDLSDIDLSGVDRFVFVCSGNICRSPLGEYRARALGLTAESYGLHCRGGDPADPRTLAFGRQMALDLRPHVTRNIRDYHSSPHDLIIAMEPAQAEELLKSKKLAGQVTLASLWLNKPSPYLHDPFCAPPRYFERCSERVIEAVDSLHQAAS